MQPTSDYTLLPTALVGQTPTCKAPGRESRIPVDDSPSHPASTSRTIGNSGTSGTRNTLGWQGGSKRKWQHTAQIDTKIISAFKGGRGVEKTIGSLAADLGWADKAVRRRAKELGVYAPGNINVPWSEAELEILRVNEVFSTAVVRKRLAAAGFTRKNSSINSKRRDLQLTPEPFARRKYRPTEAIDEAIRQAFGKKYERLGCIRGAVKATGWPKNAVIMRAVELGLTHPRSDVPWTDAEEQLLEEYAHQSIPSIQIHLKQKLGKRRTQSSIAVKRSRMALLGNLHGMDLSHLATALGMGEVTVRRWLETGEIRAILRFPELQSVGRHVWFFPNEEIRRFILEHLEVIDLARVEKFWFVDLIANGKAPK